MLRRQRKASPAQQHASKLLTYYSTYSVVILTTGLHVVGQLWVLSEMLLGVFVGILWASFTAVRVFHSPFALHLWQQQA